MIYISTIINPSGNRINVLFYDDQEDCFYSTGDKKALTIQILPPDNPIDDKEIFNIDPKEFVVIGEPRGNPKWTGNTIRISGQEINQIRSSSCCEGCPGCGSEPSLIIKVKWVQIGVAEEGEARSAPVRRRGGGKIKSSKRRRKSRKRRKSLKRRKSKRKSTRRRG